jgi:hypothetical protein
LDTFEGFEHLRQLGRLIDLPIPRRLSPLSASFACPIDPIRDVGTRLVRVRGRPR